MSKRVTLLKFLRLFQEEVWCWYEMILWPWPGRIGMYVRGLLYAPFLRASSFRLKVSEGVHIWKPGNIEVGRDVRIGRGNHINAIAQVKIGDNVMLGLYVVITTANHSKRNRAEPIKAQGLEAANVSIGDDVWVGSHVTILPGVSIGQGCVVAAGAVVTRSVSDYTIVAGVPAREIGKR